MFILSSCSVRYQVANFLLQTVPSLSIILLVTLPSDTPNLEIWDYIQCLELPYYNILGILLTKSPSFYFPLE
jgi:hypothetical protein